MSHAWLTPSSSTVARIAGKRAAAALRELAAVPLYSLGPRAAAWPPLLEVLPALLRADADRLLNVVARVDVLSVLLELPAGAVDAGRVERALVTLWLGIAAHPGLAAPLALPGPFRQRAVDPRAPRVIALGNVRGLIATARGPVVVGQAGRLPLERFAAALPEVNGTVIVDAHLGPPDAAVVARVRHALALVEAALPGGHLERVMIGSGDAGAGEARVTAAADPADLVASAQAAFVRAAATLEPVFGSSGVLAENGRRLSAVDTFARACGNVVALPWRADREAAAAAVVGDLEDLVVLADPTPNGEQLLEAIRAGAGGQPRERRRALFVNVDADDFVYSFQFGQSIERRCVERGLCVDRITIDGAAGRDLAGEIGGPIPAPLADGTEFLVIANDDPALAGALGRLSTRRYDFVVVNARPKLFYRLVDAGLLTAPTLVWDRHLHDGLSEERSRSGRPIHDLRPLPIRLWSLLGASGSELERGHESLLDAGLERVTPRPWPMDLDFFRSTATPHADRLFAGGDSGRDWPLFVEAIRDLPLDVHLVTARPPAGLSARVHIDARLPLARFRDAMAAAAATAIPVVPGVGAAGLTVLTMAMALGVAVVATASPWIVHYVTDGEEALLVPAGDANGFRDALRQVYEDADLRARLVANARRRVAALCDLEAFTREMFATLD